jgi:hypothetical protein
MSIELVSNRESRIPGPVDSRLIGCHTAVFAQSGSRKSFMIGQLIEEILVRLSALDPRS